MRGLLTILNEYSTPTRSLSVLKHAGPSASLIRNDKLTPYLRSQYPEDTILIRWGCVALTGFPSTSQINTLEAIKRVNQKEAFRMLLQQNNPDLVPTSYNASTLDRYTQGTGPVVVRPNKHAQGRNLFVAQNRDELQRVINMPVMRNGWYASNLIDKAAEFRVYVVNGKVATVAEKTPEDPSAVAWNVAQGGRFDVVRWGDWNLDVCRVAIEAFKLSSLDFGGVDVMVDRDGRAYVIEINSAPSLPLLSDGGVSYRQRCMAKCFRYIAEHGEYGDNWLETTQYTNWRDVIHPAVT